MHGFVIGPIGDQLAAEGTPDRQSYETGIQVFEEIIIPAWEAAGLDREDITRADELDRPGDITEQVVREILGADLVIADLSGANPNVMYELGLRHAASKPVIQIGEYGRLPFDVSVIRTIIFTRSANGLIQGRKKLTRAIQSAIRGDFDLPTASRVFSELICGPSGTAGAGSLPSGPAELTSEEPPEVTPEELEEPPGFLELISDMEVAMPEMNERLNSMVTTTTDVGELAERHTERLERQATAGQRLAIVNSFAQELEPLALKLDRDSLEFAARTAIVEAGLGAIFGLLREDTSRVAELREMLESIVTMKAAAVEAVPGVQGFRESANELQKSTKGIRPVIRLLVTALDRNIKMFQKVIKWGEEAEQLLSQYTDRGVQE